MFAKQMGAFFALALVLNAQAAPPICGAPHTVTVTVHSAPTSAPERRAPIDNHHTDGNGGGGRGGSSSHRHSRHHTSTAKGATSTRTTKGATSTSTAKGATSTSTAKGATSTSTAKGATSTSPANSPTNTSTANPTNPTNNRDPQKSLTLLKTVISGDLIHDGQSDPVTPGQEASLTSGNNFINFCATVSNLPLTNGKQIPTGSCNPVPFGIIPDLDHMPSAKFQFPKTSTVIPADEPFTISVKIQGMETGHFTNAEKSYFAAPQQLTDNGQIKGHSHVVVEALNSLNQTEPPDPTKFAFFKGLNAAAQGGILTANVTAGLPAGAYRVSTITTAANHQSVVLPVAQRGSTEDAIYFTVADTPKNGKRSSRW